MNTKRASHAVMASETKALVPFIGMKRLSFATPALRRNYLSASQLSGESMRLAGNNLPMSGDDCLVMSNLLHLKSEIWMSTMFQCGEPGSEEGFII